MPPVHPLHQCAPLPHNFLLQRTLFTLTHPAKEHPCILREHSGNVLGCTFNSQGTCQVGRVSYCRLGVCRRVQPMLCCNCTLQGEAGIGERAALWGDPSAFLTLSSPRSYWLSQKAVWEARCSPPHYTASQKQR